MKKLLLGFLATILFSITINARYSGKLPEFPTYSQSMDLGVNCSADCTFSSCSGSGSCICTCNWFKCNCLTVEKDKDKELTISMNESQYIKTRDLANFFKNLSSQDTDNIYKNLATMVSAIKIKDFENFEKERSIYISGLEKLPTQTKEKINNYFIKVGASERL